MVDPLAAIVGDAQRRSAGVRSAFAELMPPPTEPWHPIPYFGPLDTAAAITVAMNPSADEFRGRRWPGALTHAELATRLRYYFASDAAPPHPWFEKAGRSLLACGLRYGRNLAHVDVVCRATRTLRGEDAPAFLRLAEAEDDLFFRCLDAARGARIIVLSGSLTGRYYLHEFIARRAAGHGWLLSPRPTRQPGGPFAAWHTLTRGDRRVRVLFTSASANRRTGPEAYEKLVLTHRDGIRSALATA